MSRNRQLEDTHLPVNELPDADDTLPFADAFARLNQPLETLEEEAAKSGLQLNRGTCQYI